MKQPEIFKQLKHEWESPIHDLSYDEKRIEDLRNAALNAIKAYKEEKKYTLEIEEKQKELLKYFEYLDSLEK
tara:strand:- start:336 stop:551 length:216 start_codon:yes stop_codon:yes gene_type:complete